MTRVSQSILLALAGLVVSMGWTAPANAAADACQPFPQVALWEELTHDFVRKHVDQRYGGDWNAYLATLDRYRGELKAIRDQGLRAGVTWRDKKVTLKGAKLNDFLKLVDRRRAVTRCLAENESVADFSTAAGGMADDTRLQAKAPASCDAVPDVRWWKFKTHESIVAYVDRRYGGDFGAYIDKWSGRLENLQGIYARGRSAVTNDGKVLQGRALFGYIEDMEKRISVVRCLAKVRGSLKV